MDQPKQTLPQQIIPTGAGGGSNALGLLQSLGQHIPGLQPLLQYMKAANAPGAGNPAQGMNPAQQAALTMAQSRRYQPPQSSIQQTAQNFWNPSIPWNPADRTVAPPAPPAPVQTQQAPAGAPNTRPDAGNIGVTGGRISPNFPGPDSWPGSWGGGVPGGGGYATGTGTNESAYLAGGGGVGNGAGGFPGASGSYTGGGFAPGTGTNESAFMAGNPGGNGAGGFPGASGSYTGGAFAPGTGTNESAFLAGGGGGTGSGGLGGGNGSFTGGTFAPGMGTNESGFLSGGGGAGPWGGGGGIVGLLQALMQGGGPSGMTPPPFVSGGRPY